MSAKLSPNNTKLGRVKPGVTSVIALHKEDLVKFLLTSADVGYGHTKKDVLDIVSRMLARRGEDRVVTNGWWNK